MLPFLRHRVLVQQQQYADMVIYTPTRAQKHTQAHIFSLELKEQHYHMNALQRARREIA